MSTGGSKSSIDAPVAGATSGGQGGTAQDAAVDQVSSGIGGTGGQEDAGGDSPQSGTGGVGGKLDAGETGGAVGGATSSGGGTSSSMGGSGGLATGGSATGGTGGSSSPPPDASPDANPLLTGLMVYYQFESATGTVLPDSSGNGRDGTLSAGPAPDGGAAPTGLGYEFVTGKVGKALALHKAGLGYVRVPPAVFASASELTISLWVNVTTDQSWQRMLDVGVTPNPYQYGNTATGTKYMNLVPKGLGATVNNMLFAISANGYSNEQTVTAPSIAVNTWTHVTVVLAAGGGARLYLNGAEAAYAAAVTLRPPGLGTIDYAFIGKSRFDADPAFDGLIDSFRVYNRALSAAEVLALYNYTVN